MFLATFTVTILDTDLETGRIDVSHVEVGSTEINEDDVLKALNAARQQANLIVDGLKQAAFPDLKRQDCQIHLRCSNLQLPLDSEWVGKYQYGDGVCATFYFDPKKPTLSNLNTTTKPKYVH